MIKSDKKTDCSGFIVCAKYLDKHLAEVYQKIGEKLQDRPLKSLVKNSIANINAGIIS